MMHLANHLWGNMFLASRARVVSALRLKEDILKIE